MMGGATGCHFGVSGMAITPDAMYVTPIQLRKYVRNAGEILDKCKHHGIVETDLADFVISCDRPVDPWKLARAAAVFRDALNKLATEEEITYGTE